MLSSLTVSEVVGDIEANFDNSQLSVKFKKSSFKVRDYSKQIIAIKCQNLLMKTLKL